MTKKKTQLPEPWTGRLVGKMHNNCITYDDLGAELDFCKAYVSMILNSDRKPPGIRQKMEAAVESIIRRRAESGGS